MRLINVVVDFLGRVLPVAFAIFFLMAIYSYVSQDDDESDTITFTVSCESVMRNASQYPIWILDECRGLRNSR